MARAVETDSIEDIVVKMAEGNPGAATVLIKLLTQPDKRIGLFLVLWLDEFEIYGPSIWILYKDWCFENIDLLVDSIRNGTAKSLKQNGQLDG